MGFYGNITNTSKTQFQFDRTYPNRATMEKNLTTDGIYAGRYVLIEYDTDLSKTLDTFMRVYISNGMAYTTSDFSLVSRLNKKDIGFGDIVFTSNDYVLGLPLVPTDCIFWKCTSILDENSNEPATFARVVSSESSNYIVNFNIDTAKYGESRGYDSTVWQKVYVNNNEKYVQIAELNSVVPTFDIAADAPTIHPILPHFDINSTNVYYKLHWLPLWGFRAKEAKLGNKTTSNDKNNYPSDEKIKYNIFNYDSDTGTTNSSTIEYDAAIYYNKLGFDKNVRTKVSGEDHIQVLPTGISGTSYNTHSLTEEPSNNTQADIQEFLILLPSLGNTISDVWDIIYGYGGKVLPDETYDPNIPSSNQNRFKNIEWKDAKDDSTEGMTRDLGTLAGCINKVHDLMGMIITNKNDSELTEAGYNNNYIYRDNDNKYYRIHKYPTYTTSVVGELNLPKRNLFNTDLEYNTAYEIAILDKLSDNLYYLIINDSSSNKQVETLNKKSLSTLNDTDIIGYLSGYDYEYVLIPDMPGKMATIYGLILKIKNLLEIEDFKTRDTSTVIGSINTLNDIIDVFEDLVPGEFLICDSNGRVNSANWTTAQDYSYTNYNSNNPRAVSKTFNTKENRWISLSLDEENRNIELKHVFNKIDDTTTTADKNNASTGDGINKSTDDTLKLYTPIIDAMGHVVGKNIETVTLPYGYKTFLTNGRSSDENTKNLNDVGKTTTTANNTLDTINIDSGNYWIRADITDDNIKLSHSVRDIDIEPNNSTNFNTENNAVEEDNLNIPDWTFDAAGHIRSKKDHYYTLPFGYKTIKTNGRSNTNSENASTEPINTDIIADKTQDTLTLNSGNKWIRIDSDAENDKLTFSHDIHNFESGSSNTKYGLEADVTVSDLDIDNTFEVPVLKFDEAGHITMAETHIVTLPENFDKVAVTVTGKDSVAVNGTSAAATILADTLTDSLTFDVGNRWVQIAGNDGADKITIYHAAPGAQTNTTKVGNETPDYGVAFNIPEVKYDEAGHISGETTHTVTFPTPSLNDLIATDSSVITGLSMTDGKLSITQTNANVGTRTLADYIIGTNNADIVATDSINSAFGKLQVQMHEEKTARENEDTKLLEKIDAEVTNRTNAINALNYTEPAVTNEYISNVTQTNGKIAVTRASLPDYSEYWSQIVDLKSIVDEQTEAITALQNTIKDLTARIAILETYHPSEEVPEETPEDLNPIE